MQWQEVCEHPSLQDLPFKIELNEKGQIIMSPVKVYHSAFQGRIVQLLPMTGRALAECAIKTEKGTKVADVAWASEERFALIQDEVECSTAPEICIEVLSSSNTPKEIVDNSALYFQAGAEEVWICDESGRMTFLNPTGEIDKSERIPDFPGNINF